MQISELMSLPHNFQKFHFSILPPLKPQDSFGEFYQKKILIFRKYRKSSKTPSDLPAIVLNDIL